MNSVIETVLQVRKEDLKTLGPQFEELETLIERERKDASNAVVLLYEVYSETQKTFVKDGTYKLSPKLKQTIDYFLFNGFTFPKEQVPLPLDAATGTTSLHTNLV